MNAARCNVLPLVLCLLLAACGGSDDEPRNQAEAARAGVAGQAPGATPFVATLSLSLEEFTHLASISYTITPKPGTYSKPLSATYTRAWLERSGAWRPAEKRLAVPVFGLYAGHANELSVTTAFEDKSRAEHKVTVVAPAYTGPAAVYETPQVNTARSAGADPGFDYMLIKNNISGPAVLDTDGKLRWVGPDVSYSYSVWFGGDAFYSGSATTPELVRFDLAGAYTTTRLASARYTNFHHDLSSGKQGLLAELDALDAGVKKIESILVEIGTNGEVLKEWDLARIFRDAMQAGGDDSSNFVRDGADWFHMNSAIYVPADDSLLVSSRENFVVKLDYSTGRIKWLLGDTTKHWHAYPSLRALALQVTGGAPPIGQHSLSIASNGDLLLFNNGYASVEQPPGTSPGLTRSFSAPSRYTIDENARTAAEVWTYVSNPPVYSDICSSTYETTPGNYLVTYAAAAQHTRARLLSVNSAGQLAFDYEYPNVNCSAVFLVQPVAFGNLVLK